MSEREMHGFLQDLEGEEKSPELFEVEMKAWYGAVFVADYLSMFRAGALLKTNIHGEPFESTLKALQNCEYSDRLSALHSQLVSDGLQVVKVEKPKLSELFPGPAPSGDINNGNLFAGADFDSLREDYLKHFFKMMYCWGHRDIMTFGTQGYLDKVPDQLSLFTFCAPDGTKSFITQDGYMASGYEPTPDFERPISQRGGKSGFLRSDYEYDAKYFEDLFSQATFIAENQNKFVFDASDLLGYRAKDITDPEHAEAWAGWHV